jgi:uncharacterized membrane protein YhaH (DUF805 family)
MLSRILLSYKSGEKLNRIEFLAGQILISSVFIAVNWLYLILYEESQIDVAYLIGKSLLVIVLSILLLPLLIARLRDMGWNPLWSILVFPTQLVQTRNLVIYMELNEIESISSLTFFAVEALFTLIFLVLFICMLIVKSAPNDSFKRTSH